MQEFPGSFFRSIVLHATLRLVPLLKQIRKGLEVYNFVDILENHSGLCHQFFVPDVVDDDDDKVSITGKKKKPISCISF